jgi:hypothetical protein
METDAHSRALIDISLGVRNKGPSLQSASWSPLEERFPVRIALSGLGGLVVSMLASGTQVRGFKSGRSRRIFRAKKSSACLPS